MISAVLLQLAVAIPNCGVPKLADEPEARAVLKTLEDQAAAWNKGDLKGFMDGYWDSDELTFYSGKDKQKGWKATFDRYKARYQGEGKEMGTVKFTELELEMLGKDHCVVKGRWQLELKKENPGGLFTVILRKTDKGWKIIHDHTSN